MSEITVCKAGKMDRRQFLTAAGGLLLAFTLDGAGGRAAQAAGTGATTRQRLDPHRRGRKHHHPDRQRRDGTGRHVRPGPDRRRGADGGLGAREGAAGPRRPVLGHGRQHQHPRPLPAHARRRGGRPRDADRRRRAETGASRRAPAGPRTGPSSTRRPTPTLTYGALAPLAATLPVPANPPLTPSSAFRLIGQSVPRTDLPAKTDGSAIYGIDVRLPGMVYAVIKHCPSLGGTLQGTAARPPGGAGRGAAGQCRRRRRDQHLAGHAGRGAAPGELEHPRRRPEHRQRRDRRRRRSS